MCRKPRLRGERPITAGSVAKNCKMLQRECGSRSCKDDTVAGTEFATGLVATLPARTIEDATEPHEDPTLEETRWLLEYGQGLAKTKWKDLRVIKPSTHGARAGSRVHVSLTQPLGWKWMYEEEVWNLATKMPSRNQSDLFAASNVRWSLDNQQLWGQGLRWSEAAVIETICSLEKTFGAETIKPTTSCITSCQEMPRYVARARYPQRPSPATFEMWNSWPAKQNLRGWYAVQLAGMRFALGGRNASLHAHSWAQTRNLRPAVAAAHAAAATAGRQRHEAEVGPGTCAHRAGTGEQKPPLQRRPQVAFPHGSSPKTFVAPTRLHHTTCKLWPQNSYTFKTP